MPTQPFLSGTDDDIDAILDAFDLNISPLAGRYGITSMEMFRVTEGHRAWHWLLEGLVITRAGSESFTATKDQMRNGPPGLPQALPTLPALPAVPVIMDGGVNRPVKWEPDFFVFFGMLAARIKDHIDYRPADGQLLKIVGAVIPPPDPQTTAPALKAYEGTGGVPTLEARKGVFTGFDFWYAIGAAPEQYGGFSSTRTFEHLLPKPPAGTAVVITYTAQYRYKGKPFGQRSQPVEFTYKG